MLYKRGQIFWYKFKIGGSTVARSTGSTSKREAEGVERDARRDAAKEHLAGRTGRPIVHTYSEAVCRWAASDAPASMLSHARNTRPYLDSTPLESIVPKAHAMKAAMLAQGLSVQTVNRRLAVVRRVLNVAYREWDWISQPLGQKIKLLSEKGCARELYLSREEVDGLLAAVTNPEARKVMVLAAYTGLRRSELLKLMPGNWQSPYLVLSSNTKSKKPRTVPVIEGLHDLVTLPFDISEHELRIAFEQARTLFGRPDLRFHDLRHTFASWLMANPNVPVTMVRDLMGHSNLGVTSKYSHLRGDTFGLIDRVLGQVTH